MCLWWDNHRASCSPWPLLYVIHRWTGPFGLTNVGATFYMESKRVTGRLWFIICPIYLTHCNLRNVHQQMHKLPRWEDRTWIKHRLACALVKFQELSIRTVCRDDKFVRNWNNRETVIWVYWTINSNFSQVVCRMAHITELLMRICLWNYFLIMKELRAQKPLDKISCQIPIKLNGVLYCLIHWKSMLSNLFHTPKENTVIIYQQHSSSDNEVIIELTLANM